VYDRQMLHKWREFYATALFDLPAAVAQSLLPGADQSREKCLTTAAWRAYDAWLWLINETANQLYSADIRSSSAYKQLRLAGPVSPVKDRAPTIIDRENQSYNWLEAR
jgi:hypothetical protein